MKICRITILALVLSLSWNVALAQEGGSNDGATVVSKKTIMMRDASGRLVQKTIVKKQRTVIDFEEASIEGSLKKPNAAYLMHGADLDFKQLYRIKNNQRERMNSAYEYVR